MTRRRITIIRSGGRRTVRRGRSRSPKQRKWEFWSFFRKWFYGASGRNGRRYQR